MATICNLYIDQGSDYATLVHIKSIAGLPLNLTGSTVKSQMRKAYASSIAYTLTATVESAVDGIIRLALTSAQSELIPAGRWLYDVEVTHTLTSVRKRVVEGIIVVTPQITQI
jgi:hypothetical protein